MNWAQTILNLVLPMLITQLKGGAQETVQQLLSGQPVKIASISLDPNDHYVFSVSKVA